LPAVRLRAHHAAVTSHPGPVAAFVISVLLLGQSPRPDGALDSVVDAERAFARTAEVRGIRAAFLEFLDDEAIGFEPELGRAKDVWRSRSEPADPLAARLEWEPRTGEAAASGDLAWLTGPYRLVRAAGDGPPRHGCYFSVWRRPSPAAPWRVLLDVGISTPAPCEFAQPGFVPFATVEPVAPAGRSADTADLLEADRRLGQEGIAGLAGHLHPRARLHRPGRQPVLGAEAARRYLSRQPPTCFDAIAAGLSRSGRLGYSYGRFTRDTVRGYYLRVWRRAVGGWQVVADIESPQG
jgi:hypothetical protein